MNCLLAALTVIACAALLGAAVLAPAPLAVLPLLVAVCIGCPMALAWSLPDAIAVIRDDARALSDLRSQLNRLPETDHPLGL